ncbi:MAG: sensor domain-containing diguanylate cyclase [Gemmatimonadaceae bacterium]|nr:sensor domain-containing diguanylate cyclase [Gemmatimonadaceae bacterium]
MITIFNTGFADLVDADELQGRLADPSRLKALRASGLLEPGAQSQVLDRLARLAARLLGVPAALVTLVDTEAQHFPGMFGLDNWAAAQRGTSLTYSFCRYVAGQNAPLIVADASQHPTLRESRGHTELDTTAYAGVPLRTPKGDCLGALCAINSVPVEWTAEQVEILEDLAQAAMAEIELRSTLRELANVQDELHRQALHDALTGLLNRRGFAECARQHIALAQRTFAPLTLVMVDLDGFKTIKDTLGHDVGDVALTEMAALLQDVARDSDVVARLGGDEFAVLLTGTAATAATQFRARLESALTAFNAGSERRFALRASTGTATWLPEYPSSLATLQRLADEAMYADKRARREAGSEATAA